MCTVDSESVAQGIEAFFKENRAEEFMANIQEEKKRFQWDYFAKEILKLAFAKA